MLTSRKIKAVCIAVLLALSVGSTGIALWRRGFPARDDQPVYVETPPDRTPPQSLVLQERDFTFEVKQLRSGLSPEEVARFRPIGVIKG